MAEDLETQYKAAVEFVKQENPWSNKVPTDRKLNLYKFFKQVNDGDVQGDRPGMFNFSGRQKWDAWKAVEGLTKEQAMQGYIDEIESQKSEFGK